MIDAQKKWPLGLSAADEPLFFRAVALIFLVLFFFDAPVTAAVIALPDYVRAPFRVITRAGNSDWILIPTLVTSLVGFVLVRFVLTSVQKVRAQTVTSVAFFIFAGVAIPGIIAQLIKRFVGRARPINFEEFGVFHFSPLQNGWSFHSFPSGDATTIFALALIIMFFAPKLKWYALAGAAMVGLSRIMVGMHFPTDVFGGVLLGTYGAHLVRNYCAQRGWIFIKSEDGRFVPNLNWPAKDTNSTA